MPLYSTSLQDSVQTHQPGIKIFHDVFPNYTSVFNSNITAYAFTIGIYESEPCAEKEHRIL